MTDDPRQPHDQPVDQSHDQPDDELLRRLEATDPATDLAPLEPGAVTSLVKDVMSTELTTETRETGTRQRGRLTWLVAAAAVLVIAVGGVVSVRALTGDDAAPVSGDPVTSPSAEPAVTRLTVPDASAGKCMVPTAEVLSGADVAFEGTVTAILGDKVRLARRHWYTGQPTDEVLVTAPSEQMQQVASAVSFQEGGRYLVAAVAGQVFLCGFSAAYDADLAAVYDQAFG